MRPNVRIRTLSPNSKFCSEMYSRVHMNIFQPELKHYEMQQTIELVLNKFLKNLKCNLKQKNQFQFEKQF